jgi:hypothetical protein
MWRRVREPRRGDRRAVALDGSGLVCACGQWRALLSQHRAAAWALEEHDGQLWLLQAMSQEATAAARFVHEPPRRRVRQARRER